MNVCRCEGVVVCAPGCGLQTFSRAEFFGRRVIDPALAIAVGAEKKTCTGCGRNFWARIRKDGGPSRSTCSGRCVKSIAREGIYGGGHQDLAKVSP